VNKFCVLIIIIIIIIIRQFIRRSNMSIVTTRAPYTCNTNFVEAPKNDVTIKPNRHHECRAGSSHSGWVSLGTLLVPLPSRTIVSLPSHSDHLVSGGGLQCRLPENYLAEDNQWWPSVFVLQVHTAWRKARDRNVWHHAGRHYGNPPLRSPPIKKMNDCTYQFRDHSKLTLANKCEGTMDQELLYIAA